MQLSTFKRQTPDAQLFWVFVQLAPGGSIVGGCAAHVKRLRSPTVSIAKAHVMPGAAQSACFAHPFAHTWRSAGLLDMSTQMSGPHSASLAHASEHVPSEHHTEAQFAFAVHAVPTGAPPACLFRQNAETPLVDETIELQSSPGSHDAEWVQGLTTHSGKDPFSPPTLTFCCWHVPACVHWLYVPHGVLQ